MNASVKYFASVLEPEAPRFAHLACQCAAKTSVGGDLFAASADCRSLGYLRAPIEMIVPPLQMC
jgi:hypothetical protein